MWGTGPGLGCQRRGVVSVPGGEVRQDEGPGACPRSQFPSLPGGEVAVLARQPAVVIAEGGLRNEEVDAVGQLFSALTGRRVHHESEALAWPRNADVVEADTGQASILLQAPDRRTRYSCCGQAFRQQGPAIRFHQPVAVSLDAVLQWPDVQAFGHRPASAVGVEPKVDSR